MKAPKPTESRILVPAGTHIAVLYRVVDIGTQETEFNGQKKKGRKILLSFELPKKRADFDGVSKPLAIHKEFAFTMYSKGTLRSFTHALLGRALSDEEADDLDVEELLGKAAGASVLHEKGRNGKIYANFTGLSPLMDGIEAPKPENKVVFYSAVNGDNHVYQSLPNWIKDKVKVAPEFGQEEGDEIPF